MKDWTITSDHGFTSQGWVTHSDACDCAIELAWQFPANVYRIIGPDDPHRYTKVWHDKASCCLAVIDDRYMEDSGKLR